MMLLYKFENVFQNISAVVSLIYHE